MLIGNCGSAQLYKGYLFSSFPVAVHCANCPCERSATDVLRHDVLLLSRIRHPNIVLFMGIALSEEEVKVSVVNEWIDGPRLHHLLVEGLVQDTNYVPLLRDIATAVHHLHSQDPPIVHHFVNPYNVCVANFVLKPQAKLRMPGFFSVNSVDSHTGRYMPPEDPQGESSDKSADAYSLGVLILQIYSLGKSQLEASMSSSTVISLTSRQHQVLHAIQNVYSKIRSSAQMLGRSCSSSPQTQKNEPWIQMHPRTTTQ